MDELMSKALIVMSGEEWRQMRATLSPAFTGSKMRQMFELISECADEMVEHLSKTAKSGEKLNVDLVDFYSRYSNDVIATCAFGIKVNSIADPENIFYLNGKKLLDFSGIMRGLKFLIILFIPTIARTFHLKIFDQSVMQSFKNIILDTMEMRQKMNIYRPDMINIMMQVRAGKLNEQSTEEKSKSTTDGFATAEESDLGIARVTRTWSDNEIVAQCLLFFIAGFASVSLTLSMISYELTKCPDIQQKLYEEIADVNAKLGGKRISYDTIQKMKYLDQVICEALRLWPLAAVQSDRKCVKDYTYDDGQRKFQIEKGSTVIFSIFTIHRNPKYYPNPDVFDPERFNDENKQNIIPGTYMPFSLGPRNCIGNARSHSYSSSQLYLQFNLYSFIVGSRFALMELKAILYYLLLNFSLEVNENTQIPLKFKKGLVVATENGVHVELKPRCGFCA